MAFARTQNFNPHEVHSPTSKPNARMARFFAPIMEELYFALPYHLSQPFSLGRFTAFGRLAGASASSAAPRASAQQGSRFAQLEPRSLAGLRSLGLLRLTSTEKTTTPTAGLGVLPLVGLL